jgi:hypothetical protein
MQTRAHGDGITVPLSLSAVALFIHNRVALAAALHRHNSCVQVDVWPQVKVRAVVLEVLHVLDGAEEVGLVGIPKVGKCSKLLRRNQLYGVNVPPTMAIQRDSAYLGVLVHSGRKGASHLRLILE